MGGLLDHEWGDLMSGVIDVMKGAAFMPSEEESHHLIMLGH